jgi:hypothetical protein
METVPHTVVGRQDREAVKDVREGLTEARLNSFILASKTSLAGDETTEEKESTSHQRHGCS